MRADRSAHSYNLGRRIFDAKTYPVQSPQGATILLFGQENGLTVVWRGGKRLKALREPTRQNGVNKPANDSVMIIDSDDDEPTVAAPSAPFVDKPEFEEDLAQDESGYPETVQTLDLAFGTAVRHIAVLPIAPCPAAEASWAGAKILAEKMVIALSTSANAAYIITLPLTPPSHESKARDALRKDLLAGNAGKGLWGETVIQLSGQNTYSDGIAMQLVKNRSRRRSRSRSRSPQTVSGSTRVIVAANTREARGTLRLWDVTVASKNAGDIEKSIFPFQTEYMPSFVTGLAFNSAHTTQLMVSSSPHAIRLYDYSIPSFPGDDASEGPFPSQGSWLLSLYPPFVRGGSFTSIDRKPIVAAAWISNGRAILVLLADGQWGIWDVEGAGPSIASNNTSSTTKPGAGLRGTSLTAFSVTGYLEGASSARTAPRQSGTSNEFVPMTPHTRRETATLTGAPERLTSIHGGIEITRLPHLRGSSAGTDESAVLWLGGTNAIVAVIPGIASFWDAQLRKGNGGGANLFSGVQTRRVVRISDLSVGLAGERCTGVTAVVNLDRKRTKPAAHGNEDFNGVDQDDGDDHEDGKEGLPIEVLVRGETRFVVVRENASTNNTAQNKMLATRKAMTGRQTATKDSIILYPSRPQQPVSSAFDLSVSRSASAASRRPEVKGAFDPSRRPARDLFAPSAQNSQQASQDTVAYSQPSSAFPSFSQASGLAFANTLEEAADNEDDVGEVNEEAVEEELMDVMEIDRMLESMEEDKDLGSKHVFFEEEVI
jgi:hypothetical protein